MTSCIISIWTSIPSLRQEINKKYGVVTTYILMKYMCCNSPFCIFLCGLPFLADGEENIQEKRSSNSTDGINADIGNVTASSGNKGLVVFIQGGKAYGQKKSCAKAGSPAGTVGEAGGQWKLEGKSQQKVFHHMGGFPDKQVDEFCPFIQHVFREGGWKDWGKQLHKKQTDAEA